MTDMIIKNFLSALILVALYLYIFRMVLNYIYLYVGPRRLVSKQKSGDLIVPLHKRALGYTTEEACVYFSFLDSTKIRSDS